ncbi:MAG: hypothetical protein GY795_47790 [Desulfobacterales bacterium]|nr:hypothetical protein [Desulfobacterales bacterium]
MQIIKQVVSQVDDTLQQILKKCRKGDYVILYEGKCDGWSSHPKGVIILQGNKFLLNGKDLLYEGEWDGLDLHPKGVIIRQGNKFLLNGKDLLYEGEWDGWNLHPKGVIIQLDKQLRLYPYFAE